MNHYETLYIVHPAIEMGRLKDAIESVKNLITNNKNNTILYTEIWGKKKLAYPVEKQKYGTYVLVQYSGDGKTITTCNTEMEHNPNILAYITVKINQSEILEQTDDIYAQLESSVEQDSKKDDSKPNSEPEEEAKEGSEDSSEPNSEPEGEANNEYNKKN